MFDRGKVMTAEELEAGKDFGRYLDVDGDGIPYRTYPGTHPTKRRAISPAAPRATATPDTAKKAPVYADNMQRLLRKFETAKDLVPRPSAATPRKPTRFGVIYFGSTAPPMDEALRAPGRRRACISTALRVRAFPFHAERRRVSSPSTIRSSWSSRTATRSCAPLIVNEGNIDPARLMPILHYDGTPITARFIAARSPISSRAESRRRCAEAECHDLHRQAQAPSPRACRRNALGFTHRDYEGASRRSAPAAATIRSPPRSSRPASSSHLPPHRIAKLSGIGCSSKTPDYFLGNAHGFNSVHGRMPSVLTGANLANRDLIYLGVSGDGDSASIGLGQFAHAIRRGVEHGLYRREQRRLRPDQGPVLRDRRPRLEEQARRGQYRQRHRPRRHGAAARRDLRRRAASPATRRSSCR